MRRVLIEAGTIVTMNGADDVYMDGCVLAEGGRIAYVGPREALGSVSVDERLCLPSHAVLPGLVNAHTHLCMVFGRTIGTNVDLLRWLQLQIPIIRSLDAEAFYTAELLGCVENLKNGNTTI